MEQLQHYLADEKSYSFSITDTIQQRPIGHEIILLDNGSCKIDKLLPGDQSNHGKGTGLQVINAPLAYSFKQLNVNMVELNVYDWNLAGIKCYTKAGFTPHPDKKQFIQVNGDTWMAFNMTIDKEKWAGKQE